MSMLRVLIAFLLLAGPANVSAKHWIADIPMDAHRAKTRAGGDLFRSIPANDPQRACLTDGTCPWIRDPSLPTPVWMQGSNLGTLCGYVETHLPLPAKPDVYAYQAVVFDFAGVTGTDNEDQVAEKVRIIAPVIMRVTCQSLNFDQPDGNVLKFAIIKLFDNILVITTHKWKFPPEALNSIDASDGRTVLDYAYDRYQIEQAKSPAVANKIKTYITLLERAGAKRAKDL